MTKVVQHALRADESRHVEHVPLLIDDRGARQILGGLCAKTMYNLRRKGLPFVKIGSRVMYRPADLATWVDRQKGDGRE